MAIGVQTTPIDTGPHRACFSRSNGWPASSSRAQTLGKIPDDPRRWRGDLGGFPIARFNRTPSMQGYAPQRAVPQDEVVPDGHQCVQSGEDEDDGSGILMQFGD